MVIACAMPMGAATAADSPTYLQLGAGAFDLFEENDGGGHRSAAGIAELRFGGKVLGIGPALGVMANTDGGVFGFGGLYFDITFGHIVITPLAAVGAYHEGDSKDLGGTLQFRGSITAAYAFANRSRLGVEVGHISNAGLHDDNPGEEDAFITYALPF
ncbi:MAG: acyloxyacyl hydrolase [Geminicoccaceae bacterium]